MWLNVTCKWNFIIFFLHVSDSSWSLDRKRLCGQDPMKVFFFFAYFSQKSVELRCLCKYIPIATMWNLNCEKETRGPWNTEWVEKGMSDEQKNVVKDLDLSLVYIFGSATHVLGCPAQVTYWINDIYLFLRFFSSA